jgi:hypothetical protein
MIGETWAHSNPSLTGLYFIKNSLHTSKKCFVDIDVKTSELVTTCAICHLNKMKFSFRKHLRVLTHRQELAQVLVFEECTAKDNRKHH